MSLDIEHSNCSLTITWWLSFTQWLIPQRKQNASLLLPFTYKVNGKCLFWSDAQRPASPHIKDWVAFLEIWKEKTALGLDVSTINLKQLQPQRFSARCYKISAARNEKSSLNLENEIVTFLWCTVCQRYQSWVSLFPDSAYPLVRQCSNDRLR